MKTRTNKTWKKTIGILSAAAILSTTVISCSDSNPKDDNVESFKVFVSDLKVNSEQEMEENWEAIEKEYNEQVAKIDEKSEELESNTKEEYEKLKKDYEALKADVNTRKMEAAAEAEANTMKDLYATILTNEGDMDLTGVTATNITGIYGNFVELVKIHKDDYTREDWDEVDVLWDALNKRKNEVEADLSTKNKLQIGEEKVKYGTFKSLNKLPAKAEEKLSVDK